MEYHHPDYSKPLEVIPLCQPCHLRLPRDYGREVKQKAPIRFPQMSHSEAIKKSWVLRKKQSPNGHNIY
jgi:hypothetical protein